LISSYLGHLPVRSSSMEVVFKIFKIFKIVLGSTGLDLQMLQSMFCWFPAIWYFSMWLGGWPGRWPGGRPGGQPEGRVIIRLSQFNFKWNCQVELSLATFKPPWWSYRFYRLSIDSSCSLSFGSSRCTSLVPVSFISMSFSSVSITFKSLVAHYFNSVIFWIRLRCRKHLSWSRNCCWVQCKGHLYIDDLLLKWIKQM
jgi:hypothetical protein